MEDIIVIQYGIETIDHDQRQKPKTTPIKELRQSVNMTQRQFAEWLSTSMENIKNWERGKSQPSEMLLKLIGYYVEGHKKGKQTKLDTEKKEILYRVEIDEILDEHEKYCRKPMGIKFHYKDEYNAIKKIEKLKKLKAITT